MYGRHRSAIRMISSRADCWRMTGPRAGRRRDDLGQGHAAGGLMRSANNIGGVGSAMTACIANGLI